MGRARVGGKTVRIKAGWYYYDRITKIFRQIMPTKTMDRTKGMRANILERLALDAGQR